MPEARALRATGEMETLEFQRAGLRIIKEARKCENRDVDRAERPGIRAGRVPKFVPIRMIGPDPKEWILDSGNPLELTVRQVAATELSEGSVPEPLVAIQVPVARSAGQQGQILERPGHRDVASHRHIVTDIPRQPERLCAAKAAPSSPLPTDSAAVRAAPRQT